MSAAGPVMSDVAAERDVLCGVFCAPSILEDVQQRLSSGAFSDRRHMAVFGAMCAVAAEGAEPDLPAVLARMRRDDLVKAAGGEQYVVDLAGGIVPGSTALHLAGVVADYERRRGLQQLGLDLVEMSRDPAADPREFAARCTELAAAVMEGRTASYVTAAQAWVPYRRYLAGLKDSDHLIRIGYMDYDAPCGGFVRGEFVVLAGDSGTGKSTLGVSIIENIARSGYFSLIVSLEMRTSQIIDKLMIANTGVAPLRFRDGNFSEEELARIDQYGEGQFRGLPLAFCDRSVMTPSELYSMARRAVREYGLSFLMVDYTQLMASEEKRQTREREVADFSRMMKRIANEFNIVVMALSQVNKEGDMRESQALKQDADTVLKIAKWDDKKAQERGASVVRVPVSIIKGRSTGTGEFVTRFLRGRQRFVGEAEMEMRKREREARGGGGDAA